MQGTGPEGASGRTDRLESRTVQQLEAAVKEQQHYMQQQTDAIRGLQSRIQSAESRQRNPRVLDHGKLDVPLFYGKLGEDFTEFLDMFEVKAQALGWDDAQKLRLMPAYLRGTALATFKSLSTVDKETYAKLKDALKNQFQPAESARLFRLELHNRRQGKEESVGDYANDVLRLVRAAYPEAGTFQDQLKLEFFTAGLKPELQRAVAGFDTSSFEKAVTLAKKFEAQDLLMGETKFSKRESFAIETLQERHDTSGPSAGPSDSGSDLRGEVRTLMESVREMRIQNAVLAAQQEARARIGHQSDRLNVLREHFGRSTSSQMELRPRNLASVPHRSVAIQGRAVVCFKCGKKGHIRRNCRNQPQMQHSGQWHSSQQGRRTDTFRNQANQGQQRYPYHMAGSCETPALTENDPKPDDCLESRKLALEEKRLALEQARLYHQIGKAGGPAMNCCNFTGLRTILPSENAEPSAFRKPEDLVCAVNNVNVNSLSSSDPEYIYSSTAQTTDVMDECQTAIYGENNIQNLVLATEFEANPVPLNLVKNEPHQIDDQSPTSVAASQLMSAPPVEATLSAKIQPLMLADMSSEQTRRYMSTQMFMYPRVMCNICGKEYSKISLKQHKLRTHVREKRFKCNFCGHKFVTLREQKLHERVHTGIKPVSCGICCRSFRRKDHLKSHVIQRHGLQRADSLVCTYCSKCYVSAKRLCMHIMDKHTGYPISGQAFAGSQHQQPDGSDADSEISVGREPTIESQSATQAQGSTWPQMLTSSLLMILMLLMCSFRMGLAADPMICQTQHSRMVFQLPESYDCNITITTNVSDVPQPRTVILYRQNLLQYHTDAWKCQKISHKISAFTYFFNDENLKREAKLQIPVSQAECQRMRDFRQ